MSKEKKTKSIGKEFKEFLTQGNVISLAVGVIIGGAFQAIVNSLVNDIILPVVGMFTSGIDFSQGALNLSALFHQELAEGAEPVLVRYGTLLTAVINFLIIGLVIFLLVKGLNSMSDVTKKAKGRGKPAPEAPPAPPTTKECPFCCSSIAIKAARCPQCTSVLDSNESAGA